MSAEQRKSKHAEIVSDHHSPSSLWILTLRCASLPHYPRTLLLPSVRNVRTPLPQLNDHAWRDPRSVAAMLRHHGDGRERPYLEFAQRLSTSHPHLDDEEIGRRYSVKLSKKGVTYRLFQRLWRLLTRTFRFTVAFVGLLVQMLAILARHLTPTSRGGGQLYSEAEYTVWDVNLLVSVDFLQKHSGEPIRACSH